MGRNVTTPPAVPPSPVKSIQTGYLSTTTTVTGSGEDTMYIDIPISAVNPAKCICEFVGNTQQKYYLPTGDHAGVIMTARLTSATNLRVGARNSNALNVVSGRWTVVEYN